MKIIKDAGIDDDERKNGDKMILSAKDLIHSVVWHDDVVGNVATFRPLRPLIWDLSNVSAPRDTPTSCQWQTNPSVRTPEVKEG